MLLRSLLACKVGHILGVSLYSKTLSQQEISCVAVRNLFYLALFA